MALDGRSGVVTHWNEFKNFGFIRPDDGSEEVFFHRKALDGPVNRWDVVDFTIYPDPSRRTGKMSARKVFVRVSNIGGNQ
jgi:cold shock CspA family protein